MEEIYQALLDYFSDELLENDTQNEDTAFENYRKNIVTIIAYLIGVPDEKFAVPDRFELDEYEKVKQNEDAKTIRTLCILRTQFLRNYKSIDDARKYDMRPLETLTEYLDVEGIQYLRKKEMEVNVWNAKTPSTNIAYLNQYIQENIDKIKLLIPDWIKFPYIKSLFLMPGGYAGHNGTNLKSNYNKIYGAIYEAGKTYGMQRGMFPYQMFVSWPNKFRETDGNILFNDLKFLKLLYGAHGDCFQASRYVVDAKETTKEEVYTFLEEAVNVAIFVDCENVDPYSFGATILNLDEEILSKVKKIVLYDDVNTSTAWDYITNIMKIPVVKRDVERVLDSKSLVDVTMTAGVCEEYFRYDVESIILASSDSDFWGLIKQLPDARFLVLNEYRKTSSAIIECLDNHNIPHCYMSDFAQDSIQKFKSDVLFQGLTKKIKQFNTTGVFVPLNVDELLQELFYDANISGAPNQVQKEKDAFFNKYLKGGLLIKPVEEDGQYTFKIELYRK